VPGGPSSPVVRRRRLGIALRRLRETAGLTGDQVIDRVGWASASKLSRIENGRSRADLADVLDLLDAYEVGGPERDELVAIAREAGNTRGWLRAYPVMTPRQRSYAELESGCAQVREYAPAVVPGLLQTPGYARIRITSMRPLSAADPTPDLEVEVSARMARQSVLFRETDPPAYETVLDESAVSPRAAPPAVLLEQLMHLRNLAGLPHITLRLLPWDAVIGEWYVPQTAFSLYRFADPADPESLAVEALGDDSITSDKSEVGRYRVVFAWLSAASLSPEETVAWLDARIGDSSHSPRYLHDQEKDQVDGRAERRGPAPSRVADQLP
jgi:transcriptional regulator with XRE-family HTH domain